MPAVDAPLFENIRARLKVLSCGLCIYPLAAQAITGHPRAQSRFRNVDSGLKGSLEDSQYAALERVAVHSCNCRRLAVEPRFESPCVRDAPPS